LVKADWVMPYGAGEKSDLTIKSTRSATENVHDSTLFLRFSDKHDGIITIKDDLGGIYGVGSDFRLPRMAPLEGYQPSFEKQIYQGPGRWDPPFLEENNYIFRIRSEENEQGEVDKGMYGKIVGDIRFAPWEGNGGAFRMYYCLNPDGTRNLEFDPKRNLFRERERLEGHID
ncbi:MAG: hypothetical protein P8X63_15010, partial [Desulfuromonadaceae bacterium]